MNLLEM